MGEVRGPAPEREIVGDRAQAGDADPNKALAEEDATPVDEPIGAEKGARLRVVGDMRKTDARGQQNAHQIDARGDIRVHTHDFSHSRSGGASAATVSTEQTWARTEETRASSKKKYGSAAAK